MIDTVVLSLPWGSYQIFDPDMFQPSARQLIEQHDDYRQRHAWAKYTQNPTSLDKRTGNYMPRLTIVRRSSRNAIYTPLRVEFSTPKLIYGNNLKEVVPEDFEQATDKLGLKLFQMGIKTDHETLTNASVINVHFCKNIEMENGYTANHAIRQLNKVNYSKRLDHNKRDFRNDGQVLYLHCGTYQIVFYDKMADLKQPHKRSLDYHQNDYQLNLFNPLPKEILRWEVRLTHKNKVNSIYNKLGYPGLLTFQKLFNKMLFSKVMQHYWGILYSPEANVLLHTNEPQDILAKLLASGYRNATSALQDTTLVLVAQKVGVRGLRTIVEGNKNTRTWYRHQERLEKALSILNTTPKHELINVIEQSIGIGY